MTQREMILRVACALGEVFTPADLVVACWESSPETFGLFGYRTQFPAAHTVYSKLYGATGLISRGLIKDAPGGLSVTDDGRRAARVGFEIQREPIEDMFSEVQRLAVENALLRREVARLRARPRA